MSSSDEAQKRSVSEISHLFLSNVRDIAGNGMPRPQRTPPPSQRPVVPPEPTAPTEPAAEQQLPPPATPTPSMPGFDLTPEEFEHVFSLQPSELADERSAEGRDAIAPVTALLASHLTIRHGERLREYARHLAASGGRVGLIELDAAEFRLTCFDPAVEPGTESESRTVAQTGTCDPREVAEALEELNVDVDRWLVALPAPRTPESKALARECEHWALLATCDHDGVVAAYRTLKGWAELYEPGMRLSVSAVDAAGDAEAARVYQKLAGVCLQFLDIELEAEPAVRYAAGVAEHPVMNCRVARDKAQLASAPHWTVVSAFLARDRREETPMHMSAMPAATAIDPAPVPTATAPMTIAPAAAVAAVPVTPAAASAAMPTPAAEAAPEPAIHRVEFAAEPMPEATAPVMGPRLAGSQPAASAPADAAPATASSIPVSAPAAMPLPIMSMMPAPAAPAMDEVIDLPGDLSDAAAILSAMMHRPECGMVECPLTPPGTAAGSPLKLAISRDRTLTVVGIARRGLAELRAIGLAYRWASENLSLISMAMPQFAIDTNRPPAVLLMVDQADSSAEVLRPMLGVGHVTIRAYRTLRWGGRTGLLLEAA
jgi:hypothetical protein